MTDDDRFERIMTAVEKIAVYIESLKEAQCIKSEMRQLDKDNRAAVDDAMKEFKERDEEGKTEEGK